MSATGTVPTVLLVDDDPALLDLHETILQESCDVITATGGEEALALLKDSVDVVLLDRRMPETSGDEVLETLRDRGHDVPVGMVSAVRPDRDLVALPVDDYLTKPVAPGELREAVELLSIRASFDPACREFLALASKRSAFEDAGSPGVDDSTAVQELTARMEAIRENAQWDINDLPPADIAAPPGIDDLSEAIRDRCLGPGRTS